MDKSLEKTFHEHEGKTWWTKSRYELIIQLLNKYSINSDQAILDVGCGSGLLLGALHERGYYALYGTEISSIAVERAPEVIRANIKIGDVSNALPFDEGSFDALIASEILEHTKDPLQSLRIWSRALKPGGHAFIFVPAFNILWSGHDDLAHHYMRYTRRKLIQYSENAGYTVKFSSYWNMAFSVPYAALIMIKRLLHIHSSSLYQLPGPADSLLLSTTRLENALINSGIRLPFGVSVFVVLQKKI